MFDLLVTPWRRRRKRKNKTKTNRKVMNPLRNRCLRNRPQQRGASGAAMRCDRILMLGLGMSLGFLATQSCGNTADAERARKIWKHHEQVIVRITEEKEFDQGEFVDAVEFFEETTGIPSRDRFTDIGRLPNENLREDLERWAAWYAENQANLRWDPKAKKVLVREDK